MNTKSLYKVGPRGGLKKIGTCPINCDMATILGREPEVHEKLVWGRGTTEKHKREDARRESAFRELSNLL